MTEDEQLTIVPANEASWDDLTQAVHLCRVPWSGRDEDKGDDGIWAVTCFVVRKGYRGRGLTYPLARATVDFTRDRGARALEATNRTARSGPG